MPKKKALPLEFLFSWSHLPIPKFLADSLRSLTKFLTDLQVWENKNKVTSLLRNEAGPKNQKHRQGFITPTVWVEPRNTTNKKELTYLCKQSGGPTYIEKGPSSRLVGRAVSWLVKGPRPDWSILTGHSGRPLVLFGNWVLILSPASTWIPSWLPPGSAL